MKKKEDFISKIVYFDKETIKNFLQEENQGNKTTQQQQRESTKGEGSVAVSTDAQVSIGVPLYARIKFLFTSKLSIGYLIQRDSSTTITSTEISEFETIKSKFKMYEKIRVKDIENSSTFFRVAAGYLRIVGNNVENVNVKEFKTALESFEGYDVYSINDSTYLRFNNTAFVSNYKRNDLLTTEMDVYCVPVGTFDKSDFDFIKQLYRMQNLISTAGTSKTLADIYPAKGISNGVSQEPNNITNSGSMIKLFDVVYACVSSIKEDETK